ncbi:Uncharacterised protein [Acinetobacter baumannii]|nr:Uncharacterised protein [Acinetobacter baumannii]
MHLKNPIQNTYRHKAQQLQKQKSQRLQPHVKMQLFGLNHDDDARGDGDGDGDGDHHHEVTKHKSS